MHMKKMNRILCLLLAMVLLASLLPVFTFAETTDQSEETTAPTETSAPQTEETPPTTTPPAPTQAPTDPPEEEPKTTTVTIKVVVGNKILYKYKVTVGNKPVTLHNDKYITHKKKVYKYSVYKVSGKKTHTVTIPAYDGTAAWTKKWGQTISVIYTNHKHKYKPGYNRIYHWSICDCGDTTNEVRHVDPATDSDKTCTCGYTFSSNADLTTLWFANMQLSPQFSKEVTEYIGEVHTYQDVTETSISAHSFDALAKIQLPEKLEIQEGANKFEILVTAEDKTTTKTYTVIAVKPVKVEDIFVGTDGTTVSATLKPPVKQQIASAEVSKAVSDKMLEFALKDKAKAICFVSEFSKWGVKQTELTLSADLLKAIAEQTEADLVVKTTYESTLTIPHSEIAALVDGDKALTICITKDNTFLLSVDGKVLPSSSLITLTVPEAAKS